MGGFFYKVEQVTCPLRFVFLTMHLVMTIATLNNRQNLALDMAATADVVSRYESELQIMSIVGIACFGIEFVSLFLGMTIFIRGQMLFNIVWHAVGFSLAIPWYIHNWDIESWYALTTTFIYFPATVELVSALFVLFWSYTRY